MNYSFKFLLSIILFSVIFSEIDNNISYELKYANDQKDSTEYFEHIFDVSLYFEDYYFFTQFEYKNPALLGPKTEVQPGELMGSSVNFFYLQHSKPKYDLTFGNLYLMYGRGLSIHTYEDINIDYDNSLLGVEMIYHLKDNIDLFSIVGKKNIKSRLRADELIPSISIKNQLASIGTYASFDYFSFHYLGMIYNQNYSKETINILRDLDGILGGYLENRFVGNDVNPEDYEMKNLEHNLGVEFSLLNLDIYFEKSIVYHNKILDKRITGSRDYMSMYFNFYDFDIIYEYKNYNTPFLYNIFCNGPTVFRESNSALSSRNLHSVNFSNEYGHQVEILKSFDIGINITLNYAFALHHLESIKDYNLFESFNYIIDTSELDEQKKYKPYRQLYFEFNGWNAKDNFYYKIGYDHYYEILKEKYIETKTIPMQFTYKLSKGNSMSVYIDYQDYFNQDDYLDFDYIYLSPSYNHFGKWILTLFTEQGRYFPDYEFKKWYGLDLTFNIENSHQLSFFVGSQVGGLVCANGTCVPQPDFEEGYKVTYRTSF